MPLAPHNVSDLCMRLTMTLTEHPQQYGDYMITCPLLTLDLLWTLNLPYKMTYSLMVFLTLFTGFMAADHPYPGYAPYTCNGVSLSLSLSLSTLGMLRILAMAFVPDTVGTWYG